MKNTDKLLNKLLALKKKQKDLYEEMDDIEQALIDLGFKENKKAILVDNFRNSNKLFKTTSIKRYEIKAK